jgi:hypothetical protein
MVRSIGGLEGFAKVRATLKKEIEKAKKLTGDRRASLSFGGAFAVVMWQEQRVKFGRL